MNLFILINQNSFSIHMMDYLMLDENIYLEPDINSKFSKEEQTKILDWIGKIDSNDKTIIQIPQKGLVDEKMRETEARRFLSKHKIDIENTRIWEINTEISKKYNSKKSINSWWQFWKIKKTTFNQFR